MRLTTTTTPTILVPVNGDAQVVQAALNQALPEANPAAFTVSDSGGTQGLWEAGDTLSLSLNGKPLVQSQAVVRALVRLAEEMNRET